MSSGQSDFSVKFSTLVELRDRKTGELLVSKSNAVHPQNMARVIARGLAKEDGHNIFSVGLGNGGTYLDTSGVTRYNNPNVTGVDAKLYNETYVEVVDGTVVNGNAVTSTASLSDITSIVNVNMIIAANEPGGQWTTDSQGVDTVSNPPSSTPPYAPGTDFGYQFEFDELGCFAVNPEYDVLNPIAHPEFLLLTHIIFQPIAKSENREFELSYNITVSVS
jgi:hypothetical protein